MNKLYAMAIFGLILTTAHCSSASGGEEGRASKQGRQTTKKENTLSDQEGIKIVRQSTFRPLGSLKEVRAFVGKEFLTGMADTGERWSAGCVRSEGEPYRHLNWAAMSPSHVLMVYEEGGFAHMVKVSLIPLNADKAVWTKYLNKIPANQDELRKELDAQ